MPFPLRRVILFGTLPAVCACVARSAPIASTSDLVGNAETFMADYAADLRTGNREAVVARYDPRGVYLVGRGSTTPVAYDSVAAMYRKSWRPPASFAWHDLAFEPAGQAAMIVTGQFDWGSTDGNVTRLGYAALLCRRNGAWRIRVEDESATPHPPAATLCEPDA